MNEQIFLRIKFSIDDYVRVLTFMRSQLFINRYLFLIFPAIIFLSVVFTIYQSSNDQTSINWTGIFFAAIVPAVVVGAIVHLLNRFLSPLMLRRTIAKQYKSSPAMQEEKEVFISDAGIKSSSILTSGTINWEAFIKGVESETDFIFYTTNEFGNFIPKNAFSSETDINFVRCVARAKLGDKAKF